MNGASVKPSGASIVCTQCQFRMLFCPQCGRAPTECHHTIDPLSYCPRCGDWLDPDAEQPAPKCGHCQGHGAVRRSGQLLTCPRCRGTGRQRLEGAL